MKLWGGHYFVAIKQGSRQYLTHDLLIFTEKNIYLPTHHLFCFLLQRGVFCQPQTYVFQPLRHTISGGKVKQRNKTIRGEDRCMIARNKEMWESIPVDRNGVRCYYAGVKRNTNERSLRVEVAEMASREYGRVLLHVDMNHCYAAISGLYNPDIRDLPMAVGGSADDRHGIILTKNPIAKRYGVKTGETLRDARNKCPNLVIVPPDYALYKRFSQSLKGGILYSYSNCVESFGTDEAWVDLSGPGMTIAEGERIANEIRYRVRRELGVTVSIGVSFTKVFAKLGSDLKKPDATTVISKENYQEKIWPLDVQEIMYIGDKTAARLAMLGIYTLGELARASEDLLLSKLGKLGLVRKADALGIEYMQIKPCEVEVPGKSIGNSSTAPHDIENDLHAKCMLYILAESIGTRMREAGVRTRCISVSARDTNLITTSHQRTIKTPTCLTNEIARYAVELFVQRYGRSYPYRSIGISCTSLVPEDTPQQLDLFCNNEHRELQKNADEAVDSLNERWPGAVRRAVCLFDKEFARVNPLAHDMTPVPIYRG